VFHVIPGVESDGRMKQTPPHDRLDHIRHDKAASLLTQGKKGRWLSFLSFFFVVFFCPLPLPVFEKKEMLQKRASVGFPPLQKKSGKKGAVEGAEKKLFSLFFFLCFCFCFL
jgi:hypothetical protein